MNKFNVYKKLSILLHRVEAVVSRTKEENILFFTTTQKYQTFGGISSIAFQSVSKHAVLRSHSAQAALP